ncbi:ankyrin repeat domain-containing protein [Chitinolyticbacter meiyuanensis]|uniref:ankyrin repeat domain-containing protein n=1 Tax=Chitinolyticbacter meiyuanensis TaxID=682798 RepID=UPI001651B4E9|nr:ankyrin repeat domain-containing protein [Chitinolyticbacter meiyuanensis]
MSTLGLLSGIYWQDLSGIKERHAAGTDVNGIDANGRTPLVEAILGGTGYPAVVKLLLELKADPNLQDTHGYTPWLANLSMMGNPVTAKEQSKIRKLLQDAGANRQGEEIFELQTLAGNGELEAVRALLDRGATVETAFCSPLGAALFAGHLAIAELLLQNGANPEGSDSTGLSPMMHAADMGLLPAVQLLEKYGANVSRSMDGEEGCMTAAWYARQSGKDEVANWLARQHPAAERCRIPQSALNNGPKAKYLELYRKYTNGHNYELSTDAIVRQLSTWDKHYGIYVHNVEADRITVQFATLPANLDKLVKEIDKFCPDVISQHFGILHEQASQFLAHDREVPNDLSELLYGLDPQHKRFGHQVLARWLHTHRAVELWWD